MTKQYKALIKEFKTLFDNQSFICPHICDHCSKTADCQRETQILAEMTKIRKE